LPDDSDYGHLLAVANNAAANNHNAENQPNQVPPLPQTDFQMNSAQTLSGGNAEEFGGTELASLSKINPVPKPSSSNGYNNNHKQSTNQKTLGTTSSQQQARKKQKPSNSQHTEQTNVGPNQATPNGAHGDHYQTTGTEMTPVSLVPVIELGRQPSHQNNRRNVNHHHQERGPYTLGPPSENGDLSKPSENERPIEEQQQVVDDFHTTRSSSAKDKNVISSDHRVVVSTTPDGPPTAQLVGNHLSSVLSMHGPYGLALPNLSSGHNEERPNQNQNKANDNNSIQPKRIKQTADIAQGVFGDESEDMMTSYTRNNLTDLSQQTDHQLGEKFAVNITEHDLMNDQLREQIQAQEPKLNQILTRPNQQRNYMTAATDSFPLSVILSDLIKLTRSATSPIASNQQANLDKPANVRQQMGILQQLRSLPGPVLALLQGNQGNLGQNQQTSRSAQRNVFRDYNSMFAQPNHDASESNQHYQQIPLASNEMFRSLSSGGNLPAFPPPRGTPNVWYPPTMGGNPAVHDAINSNADFVATNVAGFVRSSPPIGRIPMDQSRTQGSFASDVNIHRRQGNEVQVGNQVQQTGGITNPSGPAADQTVIPATNSDNNRDGPASQPQVALGYQEQPVLDDRLRMNQIINRNSNVAQHQQLSNPLQSAGIEMSTMVRQKRAIENAEFSNAEVEEEEDSLDSRPVSIVMPDGRPMRNPNEGRRARKEKKLQMGRGHEEESQPSPSSSYRRLKHYDIDSKALHHYAQGQDGHRETGSTDQLDAFTTNSGKSENRRSKGEEERRNGLAEEGGEKRRPDLAENEDSTPEEQHRQAGRSNRKGGRGNLKKMRPGASLEAAGSGLMSKLLGTASSNNEDLDDDFDNDNDENNANERRKEELEDAEFGIGNERGERNNLIDNGESGQGDSDGQLNRLSGGLSLGRQADIGSRQGPSDSDSSLGSGTTDSEAFTRRAQQQQRADVQFYGHPGEETRQLKYGILGSGNYEVVNGGIYPEADESTAAVNSVANYVRKPSMLLAGLGKLTRSSAGSIDPLEQMVPQTEAYMPGGRISGGYMRGASANNLEEDTASGLMGPSGAPLLVNQNPRSLHSPLLELMDANSGQLFDNGFVAHLGSSGTSARTTFTSQEEQKGDGRPPDDSSAGSSTGSIDVERKREKKSGASSKKKQRQNNWEGTKLLEQATRTNGRAAQDHEHHPTSEEDLRAKKSPGTNQFYSYQILPSKKVTIFSDQDLDSAPSQQVQMSY